jgi:hypothetical protein
MLRKYSTTEHQNTALCFLFLNSIPSAMRQKTAQVWKICLLRFLTSGGRTEKDFLEELIFCLEPDFERE